MNPVLFYTIRLKKQFICTVDIPYTSIDKLLSPLTFDCRKLTINLKTPGICRGNDVELHFYLQLHLLLQLQLLLQLFTQLLLSSASQFGEL